MKKIIFGLCAVAGLLTACDPSVDSISAPASDLTQSLVESEFSFKQCALNEDGSYTEAADGNYFFYTVGAPYKSVVVYNFDADGNENILASGFSGNFKIQPKRGGDPNQAFYVRAADKDGTVVEVKKDVTVYVPTELSSDMKFLCSADGVKTWTWDTSFRADGGAWGNLGYAPGPGETFVNDGNGIWWGCPPADLTGQLNHSDTQVATGEEDPNAYMILDEDGNIRSFAADGTQIRSGKFRVTAWDNGNRSFASVDGSQAAWSLGTLHTDAGTILFPFQINSGGNKPTDFEIMQLDGGNMKLIYAAPGTAGWGEAYLQEVASYLNGKMSQLQSDEDYRSVPFDMRNVLLQLNLADDYFKARSEIRRVQKLLEEREQDLADLKHTSCRNADEASRQHRAGRIDNLCFIAQDSRAGLEYTVKTVQKGSVWKSIHIKSSSWLRPETGRHSREPSAPVQMRYIWEGSSSAPAPMRTIFPQRRSGALSWKLTSWAGKYISRQMS